MSHQKHSPGEPGLQRKVPLSRLSPRDIIMPPKKNQATGEEMEEIKLSLNFMSEEISKVAKQQSVLIGLMEEVKELKIKLIEKDKKITVLERRVDELEQYTRMEDVIMSGLSTRHRSYARMVAEEGNQGGETHKETYTIEQQVVHFLESKNIVVDSKMISACHMLPRKDKVKPAAIVIRFTSRKAKTDLLRQTKKLRGTAVYINEHLTKKNSEIAGQARALRKQGKIQSTWTRNCKVWIKLLGTPEEAKVLLIRDIEELEKFK